MKRWKMPQISAKAIAKYFASALIALCLIIPLQLLAQNLEDLQSQLLSEDVKVREKAVAEIVAKGRLLQNDSLQLLVQHADDEAAAIRLLVAQGLGKYVDPEPLAVDTLLALLQDSEQSVRLESIQSIGRLAAVGQSGIKPLTGILADGTKQEKISALAALANFKQQATSAIPAIAVCLNDKDWLVRSFAIEALLAIGGEQAQAAIKSAMQTGDAEMLADSVVSSRAYGNSEAVLYGLIQSLKRNVLLICSASLLFTALLLWLKKKRYFPWLR